MKTRLLHILFIVLVVMVALFVSPTSDIAADRLQQAITNFNRVFLKHSTSSGPILNVNQQGTGDIVRFQDNGTTVWSIADGGDVTSTGSMTSTGAFKVVGDTDENQLTVTGYTTQTNNLLVLENSAGTDQFVVDGSGNVTVMGDFDEAIVVDGEADAVQLTVSGYTTQTAKTFVVEQSDGTDKFTVDNSGNVVAAGASDLQGNVSDSLGTFTIADNAAVTGQADAVQLTVSGYTTQTAKTFVVEQSGGTDKFTVDNSGNVVAAGASDLQGGVSNSTSAFTITDNATVVGQADTQQFVVTGYTTQTNSLLVLEQNGGGDVFEIDNNGQILNDTSAVTVTDNIFVDGQADLVQLTVSGFTTQTSNLLTLEQSDGTDVFGVDSNGQLINANSAITITDNVAIVGQADLIQLTVRGNAAQTSNTFEVQNSAGTAKAVIDNNGKGIFAGGLELSGGPFIVDRQNETVTGSWVITPTSSNIVMTSSAEFTSSTATPVITTTATDGQVIFLRNGNAADVINLDGTGGTVECKANIAMGAKDIVTLMYDATDAVWYCQSVQDNS